ncbi:hypothetical protein FOMPIDRAFT_1045339 [Fomitopsis schrenkii]|uniref:Uncharacterized protein n=1 Tax=Fomitopsis schrenkii TaxID=2126942 RepID=S8EM96_FOMSC|nr:hypothetical protein FOMPIDRAFT_1045339 [Fomitopsis schrenkii]
MDIGAVDLGYAGFSEPSPGWGSTDPSSTGDIIQDALKKEQLVKEFSAAQENLGTLLDRVRSVQGDVDKLLSENETLQMYIDNLTMQMAKRR